VGDELTSERKTKRALSEYETLRSEMHVKLQEVSLGIRAQSAILDNIEMDPPTALFMWQSLDGCNLRDQAVGLYHVSRLSCDAELR
jgi:hypothetical protein